MAEYFADVHMHIDHNSDDDSYHGEHPKKLAAAIIQTPLDFVALSEHNQVSASYFDLCGEINNQLELLRQQTGTRRQIWTALGNEISVSFADRRYHIGYVYEQLPGNVDSLPAVPERGIKIDGPEFEQYRKQYPGVAILNHPTWHDTNNKELRVTAELMRSGLVDGAELGNGCIVAGAKKGKRRAREATELFVATRSQQESDYKRIKKQLPKKERPAAKSFIAPTGSSDAHSAEFIGSMFTSYQNGDNPYDGFFEAIRAGSTKVIPGEIQIVQERMSAVLDSVQHAQKYIHMPASHRKEHHRNGRKKR